MSLLLLFGGPLDIPDAPPPPPATTMATPLATLADPLGGQARVGNLGGAQGDFSPFGGGRTRIQ